jgi:hypothetical protein
MRQAANTARRKNKNENENENKNQWVGWEEEDKKREGKLPGGHHSVP